MTLHYWTIRWVPDVIRGEYINIGVLVGDEARPDWAIRHVSNFKRANMLGGEAGRAQSYLRALAHRVEDTLPPLGVFDHRPPPSYGEIERIRLHQSNSIQLSPPRLVHADTANQALNIIYPLMVDEPEVQRRTSTRLRLVRDLGLRLERSLLTDEIPVERDLSAQAALQRNRFDFTVGTSGNAYLAHAWSFRTKQPDHVAETTGAWAWFVREFRREGAVVTSRSGRRLELGPDTPLLVVHDEPSSDEQFDVLRAARSSWEQLGARVHEADEMDAAVRDVVANLAPTG